jgi:hypothetical protein
MLFNFLASLVSPTTTVWCSGINDPEGKGVFAPSNVVDGKKETKWCGSPAGSSWLALDIGSKQQILKLKITFGAPCEYSIHISQDADVAKESVGWILNSVGSTSEGTQEIDLNATTRFIKILEATDESPSGLIISEVDVIGAKKL